MSKFGYLSAFLLPALLVAGWYIGGWGNYLAVFDAFLFAPFVDAIVGSNTKNITEKLFSKIKKQFYYRLLLYVWVPVQLSVLIWCCFVIINNSLTPFEWIGFMLGTAIVTGGIGITVAHELGHKHRPVDQFFSKVILMTVFYMHFFIEHNRGHHVKVATPSDPATALKGEGFYRFWTKSVFKGYLDAWKIEAARLRGEGRVPFSVRNQMIWFLLLPPSFVSALTLLFYLTHGIWDWTIPIFLIVQAILAFTFLELVNYVEHYGLLRNEIAPGKFERVSPKHSWNADHILSNYYLFKLQRHSDHHLFATKPYQVLNRYEESPQLPAGYPTMIVIALLPPLWFVIMNRRLKSWENIQVSSDRLQVGIEN